MFSLKHSCPGNIPLQINAHSVLQISLSYNSSVSYNSLTVMLYYFYSNLNLNGVLFKNNEPILHLRLIAKLHLI